MSERRRGPSEEMASYDADIAEFGRVTFLSCGVFARAAIMAGHAKRARAELRRTLRKFKPGELGLVAVADPLEYLGAAYIADPRHFDERAQALRKRIRLGELAGVGQDDSALERFDEVRFGLVPRVASIMAAFLAGRHPRPRVNADLVELIALAGSLDNRELWREQIERAAREGEGTPGGHGIDVDNLRDASFLAEAVLALLARDTDAFAEASRHYAAGEERHDWYGFPDLAWIALASKARRSRLKLAAEHLAGWDPRLVQAVADSEV